MKLISNLEQPQIYVDHQGEQDERGDFPAVQINPGENTVTDKQLKILKAVPLFQDHAKNGFIVDGKDDDKAKEEAEAARQLAEAQAAAQKGGK